VLRGIPRGAGREEQMERSRKREADREKQIERGR